MSATDRLTRWLVHNAYTPEDIQAGACLPLDIRTVLGQHVELLAAAKAALPFVCGPEGVHAALKTAVAKAEGPRGYRRGRDDYDAIRDEANDPNTRPVEVSMNLLWEMRDCVPPIYVPGGFLVGECITGDARGDVYAHFAIRGGAALARYAVRGNPETYIR